MRYHSEVLRLLVILFSGLLSSCGGSGSSSGSAIPPPEPSPSAAPKIQHVVIIVQENRSFNDLFYGFPGARTATYGRDSKGRRISAAADRPRNDVGSRSQLHSFFAACNGTGSFPGTDCRMNGFNNEYVGCNHGGYPPCPIKHPQYAYVPHEETKPYFDMAKQYVLADRMFASNFDASSFISHQYIIAAQASSAVNFPRSAWGCEGGPGDVIGTVTQQRTLYGSRIRTCFQHPTLGDELDKAGLSWGFYAASYSSSYINLWSAYQAIKHIYYGPDWQKDVLPNTSFFDDVAQGRMRAVSWITPSPPEFRSCGLRIEYRSLVGSIAGERYRLVEILGLDCHLYLLGRLRRVVRPGAAAVGGL